MNPIIHGELGWLLAAKLEARRDRLLVACAGIAPDLDGLSILLGGNAYGEYHHLLTHGYPAAIAVTVLCAVLARNRVVVAALAFASFHLHLLCDLAGSGPGWPIYYFWPSSRREWFWDGQWDLASWQNSVIGLAVTLACLGYALWQRRTVVELFSPRWDGHVVATLRKRFLGEPLPSADRG